MFIHDRLLQKLVKNLVILECSFHRMLSKGGKNRKKERKNTFSCVLSQGHLGQLRKVYSICCPKHYLCVLCVTPLTFTLPQKGKKKTKKLCHIPSVPIMCYCVCKIDLCLEYVVRLKWKNAKIKHILKCQYTYRNTFLSD